MHTAFALALGAILLAFAIAFGLGGRGLARKYLEEQLESRKRHDDDASAHL